MISFIIPAHNEEHLIGRTLKTLHSVVKNIGELYEIIVVNDESTDRTASIALEYDAQVISVNCRQISATRNSGAKVSNGNILFFIDADTEVTQDVVAAAIEAIKNGAIGGGCKVLFDGIIPLYVRILHPILTLLTKRLGLAQGCFLFCTRDAFNAVDGFSHELYASEEYAMSMALKKYGHFVILKEHVITSGRKLRAYSGFQILWRHRYFFLNRRALRNRNRLGYWYVD